MLSKLHIRNYALINELDIEFDAKFNIITGETGAGKSIILGAIGLLLGQRMDHKNVQLTGAKCIIEGEFQFDDSGLKPLFDDLDLDFDASTILRREISPQGKNRAFINDSPVSLQTLKNIGEKLINIHSQHSNLLLKDSGFKRDFLDFAANNASILSKYSKEYTAWKKHSEALMSLKKEEANLRSKLDFNSFQYQEIEELKLSHEEFEANEAELNRLNHSEKVASVFQEAQQALDGETASALPLLHEVQNQFQKVKNLDDELAVLFERIESACIELKDIQAEMEGQADQWQYDEARLDFLNERQDKIQRLLRKHQMEKVADLMLLADKLRSEINDATFFNERISQLEQDLTAAKEKLSLTSQKLSQSRIKAAKKASKTVSEILIQLGIPENDFAIEVEANSTMDFQPHGWDSISFLFSANKGKAAIEVSKGASGGEISRIMLALKVLLSKSGHFSTLIFDEIDLGISGEVAIKMGELMKELSEHHQLISITHLPQIAAMGQRHFQVSKKTSAGQTISSIIALNSDQRIGEIAGMIGGKNASQTAKDSALELITTYS